jgi:hypothetical protein
MYNAHAQMRCCRSQLLPQLPAPVPAAQQEVPQVPDATALR